MLIIYSAARKCPGLAVRVCRHSGKPTSIGIDKQACKAYWWRVKKQIPHIALIGLCVSGCGPDLSVIPEATPKMAMEMGVTQSSLQRGRATYMAHCNKCHERVLPAKIDPEYWREILPHMSVNAKLDSVQQKELQSYLIAAHGTVYKLNLQH